MIPVPSTIEYREQEWAQLTRFAAGRGPGMQIALVYGKRRQGKSLLLRELARSTNGLYHQALEQERLLALEGFGRSVGEMLGVGGIRPRDWHEAFDLVLRLARAKKPVLVVIDEFPYLLRHSRELPSLIQRIYDDTHIGGGGQPIRLILCGSAVSVMSELESASGALYGRATKRYIIRPFDVRAARAFWGIDDLRLAFEVDAIFGGTPAYRAIMDGPPRDRRSLGRWLARGPLDPTSLLYREPDLLLADDLGAADRGLYGSVLAAISRGEETSTKVAAAIGKKEGSIQHVLRGLIEVGMVAKDPDRARGRRPRLRISIPLVKFHHVVVRPNAADLELGHAREVWERAAQGFRSQILGPHLEDLARWWTRTCASAPTTGGNVGDVDSALLKDRGRPEHDIDVLAVRRDDPKHALLLGEVKLGPCGVAELRRLEEARTRIQNTGRFRAPSARLALFSATGFDVALQRETAQRGDVELIDLERLYRGS